MNEVQRYIQGEYLYIPNTEGTRKKWGDNSGYRRHLSIRNDNIRREFRDGATISGLAAKHYLSEETIKKVVYVRRKLDD